MKHRRFRPTLGASLIGFALVGLALAGCGSDESSGSSEFQPTDVSNDSSSPSSAPEGSSSTDGNDLSDESNDDSDVGSNDEPDGDGLSGDELAQNISKQYQTQWSEFFGMPMEDADAPVRCDGLEAKVGATTECEVKMAEGIWMPLDVEVTTVTPIGIEYSVTPNLYG